MLGKLNEYADCETCRRNNPDEYRRRVGCGRDGVDVYMEVRGHVIKRCPHNFIDGETARLMEMYPHYKNGFLPAAGGILDQCATFLRGISVLDEIILTVQKEEMDKARGKGKKT